HHLFRIHPIHVVGAEDDDVFGVFVVDEIEGLENRVGAAGVPARTESLLGRNRSDVFTGEAGQSPGLGDVPVEGVRLVLRENTDAQVSGIDEVAQDEIDQSVRAPEGHRGFRPVRGQWVQTFALAAGENDPEHVWLAPHAQPIPRPTAPPAKRGPRGEPDTVGHTPRGYNMSSWTTSRFPSPATPTATWATRRSTSPASNASKARPGASTAWSTKSSTAS